MAYETILPARQAFGGREFSHSETCGILAVDGDFVSLVLSELKRAGWLEVRINPQDSRKRVYRLVSPEAAVEGMGKADS